MASVLTTTAARSAPRSSGTTPSNVNHTSGIYADMTVDGPEIGTLVVVIDRAKNLPNLRTMGKQDPFCAARLGKEAKKTEIDKRGGQTPKWDQELRFTVHESPDYHKIKVSVFNDDKRKTDLIGETWVGLEELLRPGGGQSDCWHTLTVKGRYAGEIRIELTFYDSRPKVEKQRERKNSNTSSSQQEQRLSASGPRQLAGARSLPSTPPAGSLRSAPAGHTDTIPSPHGGPRSYHTPPRQSHSQDLASVGGSHERDQLRYGQYQPRPLPVPGMPSTQSSSYACEEQSNDFIAFTDDPYALQAVETRLPETAYRQPIATPPRHDRVQTLSGSPNPRPLPPVELAHTNSAPQLSLHERPDPRDQHPAEAHDYGQTALYEASPCNSRVQELQINRSWSSPTQGSREVEQDHDATPPPPPVHRYSAPSVPQALPRVPVPKSSNTPSRALHVSTNATDSRIGFERSASEPPEAQNPHSQTHESRHSYSSGPLSRGRNSMDSYSARYGFQSDQGPPAHLSRSSDPNSRPRNELAYDPRYADASEWYASNASQEQEMPSNYHSPVEHEDQRRERPINSHDDARQTRWESPLVVKPRDMSAGHNTAHQSAPERQQQQQQHRTLRKSISPRSPPEQTPPSTPYSPDSFNSINPAHSTMSTPNQFENKFEPTPMYSAREPSPVKLLPLSTLQTSPSEQQVGASTPLPHHGPIIGSDGRIKDPSDHLPPSSYAPEPERKPNRPSTVINVKSRFGPRGANSPTDQGNNSLNKRSSGGSSSSPLSPTHSSLLNTSMNMNSGYNLSSPYPPPVPGKIPLGGYQERIGEADHFEMAALSLEGEDAHEQPLDPAAPKVSAAGRALLSQERVRKSRWGA